MNSNIIIIIFFTVVLIGAPILIKRLTWKKLIQTMDTEDYDGFYKTLDSLACKLSYPAIERENMRLSAYIAQNRKQDIEELLNMMMNMRIKPKEKVAVGTRGFYYYLDLGKVKKARDMLDFVKANGPESSYENLELLYSVLLKKESKYIDTVKEKINHLWNGSDELTGDKQLSVGIFQYLIGLQYSYKNDIENMKAYFKEAMVNVKDTPYQQSIQKILEEKKVEL